jgi:hypothetical protein
VSELIKNPDFEEWTDTIPDGWNIYNKDDCKLIEIDKVVLRRIYHFNILGIRFTIKGRNLIKSKFAKVPKSVKMKKEKKYIAEWTSELNK